MSPWWILGGRQALDHSPNLSWALAADRKPEVSLLTVTYSPDTGHFKHSKRSVTFSDCFLEHILQLSI